MGTQIIGFAAVFVLFLACGVAFYQLTATQQALQGFQAMYYISSVFAQFVNATTFLLVSTLLSWHAGARAVLAAVVNVGQLHGCIRQIILSTD